MKMKISKEERETNPQKPVSISSLLNVTVQA